MRTNQLRVTIVLLAWAVPSCQQTLAVTITRTIQTDFNDAEEHLNDPVFSGQGEARGQMESLTSSDLETSEQGGGLDWQGLGVQWDSLGIPQGFPINSATLTFTIDQVNDPIPGQSTDFTLFAEAIDDSPDFASADFNISSRARSSASVGWDASTVPTPEVIGDTITIDVQPLVQEIINRPGWMAANQLSIMIFPDVYLANPLGSTDPIRVLELEAGPGLDSATLTVDITTPELHLNTTTGEAVLMVDETLSNNVIGYEISSADGVQGLNPDSWTSIADNYDGDSGPTGGIQVDADDNWTELPATSTTIAEAELNAPSGDGAQLGGGSSISFGQIWTPNPFGEDIAMELLLDDGTRLPVGVLYDGLNENPLVVGDYNGNGTIDAGDWPTIRDNFRADLSGMSLAAGYSLGDINLDGSVDVLDFAELKDLFIAENGAEAFAAVFGALTVPEPAGCLLAGSVIAVLGLQNARSRSPAERKRHGWIGVPH